MKSIINKYIYIFNNTSTNNAYVSYIFSNTIKFTEIKI